MRPEAPAQKGLGYARVIAAMARVLAIRVTGALLAFVVAACNDDEEERPSPPPISALQSCDRPRAKFPDLAGWSGKVAGISCQEAGRFVQYKFFGADPPEPATSYPPQSAPKGGTQVIAGFDCEWTPYRREPANYHVTCTNETQRFKFNLTP